MVVSIMVLPILLVMVTTPTPSTMACTVRLVILSRLILYAGKL